MEIISYFRITTDEGCYWFFQGTREGVAADTADNADGSNKWGLKFIKMDETTYEEVRYLADTEDAVRALRCGQKAMRQDQNRWKSYFLFSRPIGG